MHGTTKNNKENYNKTYDLFHGSDTIYGQLDQLIKGEGVYDAFFEKKVDIVANSSNDPNPTRFVLSSMFLLDQEYVLDRHFDKRMLEKNYKLQYTPHP